MRTRAVLAFLVFAGPLLAASPPVDFDRDVRPIFSDKCYTCHGPDPSRRMAGLRLDQREGGAFTNRGDHADVVPGDVAHSRLVEKITAAKPALRMPPPYSKLALTPAQIETIKTWIAQGAKWDPHWSYVVPKRPETPKVSDAKWVRNPIDAFVMAKLDAEGLKPSPEADKTILIRRVSLDLTGIAPTPAEVDAFVADKRPDAYERLVDKLLASPRYGERMTMQWLDLARYADTHGYHIDSARQMWHWRDWVINTFNNNMPFDEFTIEQLAGDLLPHPTTNQLIATGFNRNHMINFEGGAIPEEYQNEYVVDRVEATSTTWLGITLGCARCHDHKYDPIKQKEFYEFYAFFNNISEVGLDGQRGNAKPFLALPSAEQKAELDTLDAKIEGLNKILVPKKLDELRRAWEPKRLATLPEPARAGLLSHYEFDGGLSDSSGHYLYGRVERGDLTYKPGAVAQAAQFDGDTHVTFGPATVFDRRKPFTIACWLNPSGHLPRVVLDQLTGTAQNRSGIEITLDDFLLTDIQHWRPKVYVKFDGAQGGKGIEVRSQSRLDPGKWHHVAITYDGSGHASGVHMYFDGAADPVDVAQDNLGSFVSSPAKWETGNRTWGRSYEGGIDDLRFYNRALSAAELQPMVVDEPLRATIEIPEDHRKGGQDTRLEDYFLRNEAPEEIRSAYIERETLMAQRDALNKQIPTTMVMAELDKPRETAILGRGDYRNRGEVVHPGVPAMLPPLPKGAPANRLTLARWLVSDSNPLTARVVMNRYWQMYFGTGIVKTVEDFGSQGEPPSNQPLLDWLATEFIRTGWNVKAMQRLIVTSATYRQDSRVTPELLERDPENRILARGPRFRLPGEMIRDNALAASGLLKERVGGPSVFPYQPKGLWREIAFGDGFSAQSYTPSHGDDLYRRSMYTFFKRTASPPELVTFDAPDREKCTARRLLTNTPLQALVLMNDPAFIEASRVLAERMMREGGRNTAKRLDYGFRLATSRHLAPNEEAILEKLLTQSLSNYKAKPAEAAKLIAIGESKPDARIPPAELAAWTTVASTILSLDETISKE